MKLLIGLLVVIVIFYFSCLNWRRTVKAVFFILVIEGGLRKWVIPQASDMIYFLRDFVLLGAYVRYYLLPSNEAKVPLKNNLINILIFMASGWCLFQAFNPSLGSPIIGFLGIQGYLLYIPLMWMLPNLFQSEEELYRFLRSHLLLLIPVGILGIIQFFSPITSPINAYAPGAVSEVATFGIGASIHARVTSTFSYITNYQLYLIVCFGLLIPLLAIKQSRWWSIASAAEFFLVVVNTFMTGSRTPFIAAILFILGYLSIKGLRQFSKTLNWLGRLLPLAIIALIVILIGFRPVIDAFSYRITSSKDLSGRIISNFIQPLDFIKYKALDGYGAGATQSGTLALRRVFDLPPGESIPTYAEAEMGRVALELGPIGFVFWYGLRIGICIELLLVFWKVKRPFLRELALAAFLLQIIQISGFLVYGPIFRPYYWFLSGFVFLLPRLEQMENFHREQQFLQDYASSSYFPGSPDQ